MRMSLLVNLAMIYKGDNLIMPDELVLQRERERDAFPPRGLAIWVPVNLAIVRVGHLGS